MMGRKKLSEMRVELRDVFAKSGLDAAWFEEQLHKLADGTVTHEREKENLLLLKEILTPAGRKPRNRPNRKGATRSRR